MAPAANGRRARGRRPSHLWTDVELWALDFRSALGPADKLTNDGTEGSVESKAALGAAGLHKARGPPGRAALAATPPVRRPRRLPRRGRRASLSRSRSRAGASARTRAGRAR